MSLCRSESLTTVAREVTRYKLDFVGRQEVRWNKRGTVRAGDYIFSMEMETEIINWGQGLFVHHRILSAVKRVDFVVVGCHYSSETSPV